MNLVSDYLDKCRACLLENPSQLFCWTAPLETTTYEPITYLECFQKCTRLEAYADDQLPQSLCHQCAAELRKAYEFIKKATLSQKTLLMKQESLFSKADEEGQPEATGFEWVTVQKTDADKIRNTDVKVNTNVKPANAKRKNIQEISDECSSLKFCSTVDGSVKLDFTISTDKQHTHCTVGDTHFKTTSAPNLHRKFQHKILKTHADDKHVSLLLNSKTNEQTTAALTKTGEDKGTCSDKTSQESVECNVCKRIFSAAKYTAHFDKVHKKSPNGHQCPKCIKHFAYRHQLKSHFEVHHGSRQKSVPCTVCPKMFYDKNLLHTHMITHQSNEINYKCELCGKGFQRSASLRRHMIMHQGGKEQCNECAKRFPNMTELRIHMLIHKKENPFLCNICGKSFRLQGPLSYHMRKHRGEKYVCEYCGQAFSCQSSIRRHEYKHTGFPFKCPRCDTGQVTRGSLQRHLKEVHNSELTTVELREIYNSVQNSRLQ